MSKKDDDNIKNKDQNPADSLIIDDKAEKHWRGGVYLCTARDSFEADIFESKLRGEEIPCLKKFKGAGNFMEIAMGKDFAFPIDIYVPEAALEDAKNIVVAVPILSDDIIEDENSEE